MKGIFSVTQVLNFYVQTLASYWPLAILLIVLSTVIVWALFNSANLD